MERGESVKFLLIKIQDTAGFITQTRQMILLVRGLPFSSSSDKSDPLDERMPRGPQALTHHQLSDSPDLQASRPVLGPRIEPCTSCPPRCRGWRGRVVVSTCSKAVSIPPSIPPHGRRVPQSCAATPEIPRVLLF